MAFLASTMLVPVNAASAAPVTYPSGNIDAPADGASVGSTLTVTGWALDAASETGTGVDKVDVFVDSVSRGEAIYGLTRNDIGSAYGARFAPSGFRFLMDTGVLAAGAHALEVRAISTSGVQNSYRKSFTTLAAPQANAIPSAPSLPVPGAQPQQFGINDHLMWFGLDHATHDLDVEKQGGLQVVRFDVPWKGLQPISAASFDTGYLRLLDSVVKAASQRGIRPLLVLIDTPAWARGNTGNDVTPPTRPADYAKAVAFLARRYTTTVPNIAFEVWNEPNSSVFWNTPDGPDPLAYARLLRTTYAVVKTAAPSATVLGASLSFNDQTYLTDLFAFGKIAHAYDAISLHPYVGTAAPDASTDDGGYYSFGGAITQTSALMARYGDASRSIWITEMGWDTSAALPEATRADYFRKAVQMVRGWPQVAAFVAYAQDPATDGAAGLLTPSGTPTATWTAYTSAF